MKSLRRVIASNANLITDSYGTLIAFSSFSQTCRADERSKTQGVESTDEDVSTIADGISDNGSQCQRRRGQRRRSGAPQDGFLSQQFLKPVQTLRRIVAKSSRQPNEHLESSASKVECRT